MIREEIEKIIEKSIKILQNQKKIPKFKLPEILVEKPREKSHGDYSTNIALQISKLIKKNPFETAELIMNSLESEKAGFLFSKVEVAKPGFINFSVSKGYLQNQVKEILKQKDKFGSLNIGKKQKINVEFISANPTGPLTLGNGRGGFCGDVLSNVLEKAGYAVKREYYINDRGKQIKDLKKGLYKGERRTVSQIQKENQRVITKKLKIKFDVWFSEKSLYSKKEVEKVLAFLKKEKLAYIKNNALWFKSTKFSDDKDRVLIKEDGEKTYLASDIAYLKNKFRRGFKKLIFFWGADHHGYIKRLKAAAQALGYKKEQLNIIIMQLVRLIKKGKEVRMAKRTGSYVALEKLVNEVGLDAARFFFLMRSADTHLNFDLDLAKKRSKKNPVYYVQYAHARISSILEKAKIKKLGNWELLEELAELDLIREVIRFPEIIEETAEDYQVQRLPQYAIDLADSFHRFYENCRVITKDKKLTQARLGLISAVQIVLKNMLDLMGISAPEKM